MNKLLNEEILRFQLLSKYDNKKTLDENYQSNEHITEQFGYLKSLFRGEAKTLSKTATKEVESLFRTIPNEMSVFGRDAATVIRDLKTMSPRQLGDLRKTIFKNTTNESLRKEIANDMAKSKAFQDLLSSSKNERKAIDKLVRNGYSGNEAKVIIDSYKKNGGKFLDEIKSTVKPSQKNLSQNKSRTKQTYYDDAARLTNQQRKSFSSSAYTLFKDILRGAGNTLSFVVKNFWRLLWIAGTIGIAYYLWNYMNDKFGIYPKCLSPDNIPKDDWEKMFNDKLDYVKTSETGNDFIDENGGGRFYADKKFETENGKYKGTWSDDTDLDIIVKLDNNEEHIVLCQAIKDFYDPRDPRDSEDESESRNIVKTPEQIEKERIMSSWNGNYTDCGDFPLQLGCKDDDIIGTVQTCLGLPRDGKFSPKVLDKLEKEGYGYELSFDTYKRIKSRCGVSLTTSGFASNL